MSGPLAIAGIPVVTGDPARADRVIEELDKAESLRLISAAGNRPHRLRQPVRPGRAAGEPQVTRRSDRVQDHPVQRAISGPGRAISHEDVIAESAVTAIITGLVSTGSPPGTRLAVHEPQALLAGAGREAERALTTKRIHSICAGVNGSPAAMLNNPAPLSRNTIDCLARYASAAGIIRTRTTPRSRRPLQWLRGPRPLRAAVAAYHEHPELPGCTVHVSPQN